MLEKGGIRKFLPNLAESATVEEAVAIYHAFGNHKGESFADLEKQHGVVAFELEVVEEVPERAAEEQRIEQAVSPGFQDRKRKATRKPAQVASTGDDISNAQRREILRNRDPMTRTALLPHL